MGEGGGGGMRGGGGVGGGGGGGMGAGGVRSWRLGRDGRSCIFSSGHSNNFQSL